MEQHGKFSNQIIISDEELEMEMELEMGELRRGPWTVEEDFALINYIARHGEGRWNSLAKSAGLKRTGKSCRLRWLNYLRPDVRRGNITLEEQLLILELHSRWGNRWSKIAQHLPGRTDNEIKNYWRTRVQKHAKQLKCDVNSKQFKDTMRYLWMPRLVERIQAAANAGAAAAANAVQPSSSTATTNSTYHLNNNTSTTFDNVAQIPQAPENSSAAASSDSFGTPVSDLTECCYNNYPVNQDYYPANHQINSYQSLTAGGDYLNQGMDFVEQNSQWMDAPDNFWNVDDMWFLHNQFDNNV